MLTPPRGELTQREVDNRLSGRPTPAERMASAYEQGDAAAAASDRIKQFTLRAILALGITTTGFAALDQGIQQIDPQIMKMTPEQLASKVLHREVKE